MTRQASVEPRAWTPACSDPHELALSARWLEQYTAPHQYGNPLRLVESTGPVCMRRLAGRRCTEWNQDRCLPPGADHYTFWNCGGRPWSITLQPYGPVSVKYVEALRAAAGALDLEVSCGSASWYWPGQTLLVEIRRRGHGQQGG